MTDFEDINKQCFEYDGNLTIKEMLLDFLSKTNSRLTLDINEINFINRGNMLNSKDRLSKNISKIFRMKMNIIKVVEASQNKEKIIGYYDILKEEMLKDNEDLKYLKIK